ncbi:MAG: ABC transporter substrate-binding protein [Nitrososphaerota archaeon]
MRRKVDVSVQYLTVICIGLVCLSLLLKMPHQVRTFAEDEIPYGPWADEIEFRKTLSEEEAIELMEQGVTQIHLLPISGRLFPLIRDLPDLNYRIAFGVYHELTFNPVGPEFADGRLNPFYNRKIREAVNYLVNRTYIVNEFYNGMAIPKFVPLVSTFPEYDRLIDVIKPLEVKYDYNFSKAREIIWNELSAMGAYYDESSGKWYYNGQLLKITMIIRVEDERLQIGNYVADLLEQLGFTVERKLMTTQEARPIWFNGDPAEGKWHLYTGGWLTTVLSRDESDNFQFFYSPNSAMASYSPLWSAYIPSQEFSEIADRLANREWNTWDERMQLMREALPMALEDSARVWLADRSSPVVFRNGIEVVADLAAGFANNPLWSRTIRYSGITGGIIRASNIETFVEPWNPISGSTWLYDKTVQSCLNDFATINNPYNGLPMPNRFISATVEVEESEQDRIISSGEWLTLSFLENIPVPTDAWYDWDTIRNQVVYAPESTYAKAKITINYGSPIGSVKYHDGSVMSLADWVAMWPLKFARANPSSPLYDESCLGDYEAFRRNFRGQRIISTDPLIIEYYTNYTQREAEFMVSYVAEWPNMPWHAVAIGVKAEEEGLLAFSSSKAGVKGVPWMNYLDGESLSVLSSILSEALETQYRPLLASQYATAEEASTRYQNLVEWYGSHGHFWVASGPFYLYSLSFQDDTATLKAFREYTYRADRWLWLSQPEQTEQLIITVCSPVHLYVTDSEGRTVGFNPETGEVLNEIPGARYSGPTAYGETIVIPGPEGTYDIRLIGVSEGRYVLRVERVDMASGQLTYQTFRGEVETGTVHGYEATVTETGVFATLKASIDIQPDALNKLSQGKYVTCYIELPEGYRIEDISLNSIIIAKINGISLASPVRAVGPFEIGDYDADGVRDLMVKFDRRELVALLEAGNVELTVAGMLENGTPFQGTDTVTVIH